MQLREPVTAQYLHPVVIRIALLLLALELVEPREDVWVDKVGDVLAVDDLRDCVVLPILNLRSRAQLSAHAARRPRSILGEYSRQAVERLDVQT